MTTDPPPCKPCSIARSFLAYPCFSPACLYCGARIIQQLGTLPILPAQIAARRRENLALWVSHGHSEQSLRLLVKGCHCVGPAAALEPVPLSLKKPR